MECDGGTIVGTNPCVVNEPCTVALYATSAGTYHLTATSNATKSVDRDVDDHDYGIAGCENGSSALFDDVRYDSDAAGEGDFIECDVCRR